MRRLFVSLLALIMVGMSTMSPAMYAPAAADAQEMPCHQSDAGKQASNSGGDCDLCGMHLCCMAFMAPASAVASKAEIRALPIRASEGFAAGFVPDHPDPPPLAL